MKDKELNPIQFEIEENYRQAIEGSLECQEVNLNSQDGLEDLTENECNSIHGGASFVACNMAFSVSKNGQYLGTLLG